MNYNRFYALLKRMPIQGDEVKEQFVSQYTNGRTTSLREITPSEYNTMCETLEKSLKDTWSINKDNLRKARSPVLKIIQRLGIDTTDWVRINAFCSDSRIAGKEFASLNLEELETLKKRLLAIERHGGIKQQVHTPTKTHSKMSYVIIKTDGKYN